MTTPDHSDSSPDSFSLSQAFRKGLKAAQANRAPAVALWVFGLSLVLSYFYIPAFAALLDQLAAIKLEIGWPFAAISTALFAGIIPVLIGEFAKARARTPQEMSSDPPDSSAKSDSHPPATQPPNAASASHAKPSAPSFSLAYLFSNAVLWAYKGVEVDLFYRLQAWLFGDDGNLLTVALKVAVDQLIYAPILGLTTVILFYLWRNQNYDVAAFRNRLGPRWFTKLVLPVLVSNWFVWIPACVLLYCLPLGLQLPIQNLILCFWVLILMFFTETKESIGG